MKKGFSLIELLVVITVVGVLAGITTPIIWKTIEHSKQKTYDHQLLEIYKAAELYATENGLTVHDNGTAYIGVAELVANKYLDKVPNDTLHDGKMNGVVEVTKNAGGYNYEYRSLSELTSSDTFVVVQNASSLNSIHVKGLTIEEENELLRFLAEDLESINGNVEIKEVSGVDSLLAHTNDIAGTWFTGIFKENTVYKIKIESRAISPTSVSESYYPKMKFVYTDGTKSDANIIGKHTDNSFTTYEYTSASSKSLKAIEFLSESASPYTYAFNLETFALTPEVNPDPLYPKTFMSVGDEGGLDIKLVDSSGTITNKRILLLDPIRSLPGTQVSDQVTLAKTGSIVVDRKVGRVILDGYKLDESKVSLVPNSEASSYHAFEIKDVLLGQSTTNLTLVTNYFPYVPSNTSNTITGPSVSANGSNTSLYLKVSKSSFPTVSLLIAWLKNHPMEIYYELNETKQETVTSTLVDFSSVQYIYTDSPYMPKITID